MQGATVAVVDEDNTSWEGEGEGKAWDIYLGMSYGWFWFHQPFGKRREECSIERFFACALDWMTDRGDLAGWVGGLLLILFRGFLYVWGSRAVGLLLAACRV